MSPPSLSLRLRQNNRPYGYRGLKIFTSLKLRFQDFQRKIHIEPKIITSLSLRFPDFQRWNLKRRQDHTETQQTITDLLSSDRPLQASDSDPLGFNEITQGLSRFIRNPRTEPPLTIAITEEWGTGKSSLMNLLYQDGSM